MCACGLLYIHTNIHMCTRMQIGIQAKPSPTLVHGVSRGGGGGEDGWRGGEGEGVG